MVSLVNVCLIAGGMATTDAMMSTDDMTTTDELTTTDAITTTDDMTTLVDNSANNRGSSEGNYEY